MGSKGQAGPQEGRRSLKWAGLKSRSGRGITHRIGLSIQTNEAPSS
jgi:hypothetical protein